MSSEMKRLQQLEEGSADLSLAESNAAERAVKKACKPARTYKLLIQ
jgi:hypothetical protein